MVVLQVGAPNWPKLLLALMPWCRESTQPCKRTYCTPNHPPTSIRLPAHTCLVLGDTVCQMELSCRRTISSKLFSRPCSELGGTGG